MRPAAATAGGESLRTTAVRGASWVLITSVVTKVLTTASFIVLARLLDPRAFGLVALASAFVLTLQYFIGSGFAQALVQRENVDREDLDTLFYASVGLGTLFALVLVAAAWPLGAAFQQPKLPAVLCALSVAFLLTGLESVPLAVLQRRLAFRSLALRRFMATLVSSVVGVALAVAGAGVWALVGQTLVFAAASVVTTWTASGWRPGRSFSWIRFRSVLGFSQQVTGTNVLIFAGKRADDLLIAAFLGPVALGYYSVAYRILSLLLDSTNGTMASVAFPTFSKLQGQPDRLGRAYRSASRVSTLLNTPVFLLMAALAPDLVQVAFGARWAPSAPVLQLLCVFGALQTLQQFQGAVLTSIGLPGLVLRVQLAQQVTQILLFVVAAQFGIIWVAATLILRSLLFLPVLPHFVARELHVEARPLFLERLGPATLALISAAIVWLLERAALAGLAPVMKLLLLGPLGTVLYLMFLRLFARHRLLEAQSYLSVLARRRGPRRTGRAVLSTRKAEPPESVATVSPNR